MYAVFWFNKQNEFEKILKSEEEGRPNQRERVKNDEPEPECGQPGARHVDEFFLFGSANSCESKRKQKHPFLANRNSSRLTAW
jgi:hypothetical protein